MSIDVRPSEDADKFLATDQLVWFGEVTDADGEHLRLGLPEDQRFVVDLPDGPDDLHSGIYGVRPMEMSLPGGAVVPIAGLTWVGVHPDSRRRGVLAAMMADHLTRTHDAGTAVSALHASEPGIYGRFGYGMAALQLQVSIGRGTTFTAPHLEDEASGITTHLATMAAPGVAERMRACQWRTPPTSPARSSVRRTSSRSCRWSRPRPCATRSVAGSSSHGATGRTSASWGCGASTSGTTRVRPAPSSSAPSAAPPRPGWRWRAVWSTST